MDNNVTQEYFGGCACGAVRYHVQGAPVIVAQCHCDECRKLSGTGHTIGAMFASRNVSITGKLSEFKYTSGVGSEVTRAFCPSCGSPILGRNSASPDNVTLSLGTFDNADDLSIDVVIYQRDQKHWDQLGEDVACFETQPDWRPPEDS
jgi:hypothetical protein